MHQGLVEVASRMAKSEDDETSRFDNVTLSLALVFTFLFISTHDNFYFPHSDKIAHIHSCDD